MTKTRKKLTLSEVWAFLSGHIQSLSKTIAAITVISGAVFGLCTWGINQVMNRVDDRVNEVVNTIVELDDKNAELNRKQELSLKRLELLNLINYDPTNTVQITKLAKYYFITLDGDQYMSGIYSDWAAKYGADASFVNP